MDANKNFPVTYEFFKKHSHYEECIDEVFKAVAKGNQARYQELKNSEEASESALYQYYEKFYLKPRIREKYHIRFKPVPSHIREKLLQIPVKVKQKADNKVVNTNVMERKEEDVKDLIKDSECTNKVLNKNRVEFNNNVEVINSEIETNKETDINAISTLTCKQLNNYKHCCPISIEDLKKYTNVIELITNLCLMKDGDLKNLESSLKRFYLFFYLQPGRYREKAPFNQIKIKNNCPLNIKDKIFQIPTNVYLKFNENPKTLLENDNTKPTGSQNLQKAREDIVVDKTSIVEHTPTDEREEEAIEEKIPIEAENSLISKNFPISYKDFKKYSHYEEIVDKIFKIKAKGNDKLYKKFKNSNKAIENALKHYYKAYYTTPKIRKNYPIRFKPAPKRIKDLLLQIPILEEVPLSCLTKRAKLSDIFEEMDILEDDEKPVSTPSHSSTLKETNNIEVTSALKQIEKENHIKVTPQVLKQTKNTSTIDNNNFNLENRSQVSRSLNFNPPAAAAADISQDILKETQTNIYNNDLDIQRQSKMLKNQVAVPVETENCCITPSKYKDYSHLPVTPGCKRINKHNDHHNNSKRRKIDEENVIQLTPILDQAEEENVIQLTPIQDQENLTDSSKMRTPNSNKKNQIEILNVQIIQPIPTLPKRQESTQQQRSLINELRLTSNYVRCIEKLKQKYSMPFDCTTLPMTFDVFRQTYIIPLKEIVYTAFKQNKTLSDISLNDKELCDILSHQYYIKSLTNKRTAEKYPLKLRNPIVSDNTQNEKSIKSNPTAIHDPKKDCQASVTNEHHITLRNPIVSDSTQNEKSIINNPTTVQTSAKDCTASVADNHPKQISLSNAIGGDGKLLQNEKSCENSSTTMQASVKNLTESVADKLDQELRHSIVCDNNEKSIENNSEIIKAAEKDCSASVADKVPKQLGAGNSQLEKSIENNSKLTDVSEKDCTTGNSKSAATETQCLEKAKRIFFRPTDKIHSLPYLLCTSFGQKQEIINTICLMSFEEFNTLTYIFEGKQLYTDNYIMERMYQYVFQTTRIWPTNLFITLYNLCKFLNMKNIVISDYSTMLMFISPKFLHWSDLRICTNFEDCVARDYYKRTGKYLNANDKQLLNNECNDYYNRCWRHEKWIGQTPIVNESLVEELTKKFYIAAIDTTMLDASDIHEITLQHTEPPRENIVSEIDHYETGKVALSESTNTQNINDVTRLDLLALHAISKKPLNAVDDSLMKTQLPVETTQLSPTNSINDQPPLTDDHVMDTNMNEPSVQNNELESKTSTNNYVVLPNTQQQIDMLPIEVIVPDDPLQHFNSDSNDLILNISENSSGSSDDCVLIETQNKEIKSEPKLLNNLLFYENDSEKILCLSLNEEIVNLDESMRNDENLPSSQIDFSDEPTTHLLSSELPNSDQSNSLLNLGQPLPSSIESNGTQQNSQQFMQHNENNDLIATSTQRIQLADINLTCSGSTTEEQQYPDEVEKLYSSMWDGEKSPTAHTIHQEPGNELKQLNSVNNGNHVDDTNMSAVIGLQNFNAPSNQLINLPSSLDFDIKTNDPITQTPIKIATPLHPSSTQQNLTVFNEAQRLPSTLEDENPKTVEQIDNSASGSSSLSTRFVTLRKTYVNVAKVKPIKKSDNIPQIEHKKRPLVRIPKINVQPVQTEPITTSTANILQIESTTSSSLNLQTAPRTTIHISQELTTNCTVFNNTSLLKIVDQNYQQQSQTPSTTQHRHSPRLHTNLTATLSSSTSQQINSETTPTRKRHSPRLASNIIATVSPLSRETTKKSRRISFNKDNDNNKKLQKTNYSHILKDFRLNFNGYRIGGY